MKKAVKLLLVCSMIMMLGVACEEKLPKIEKVNVVENIAESTNKGIKKAVLLKNEEKYMEGDFAAEAHEILEIEDVTENYQEEEGKRFVRVYTLVTYGKYNKENEQYIRVAGSEVVPTVITFSKDSEGTIDLINYQIPNEKKKYEKEIKKIFPEKLWEEILNLDNNKKDELLKKEMKNLD